MRAVVAALALACAACGPSASTVRGIDGTPPTAHARLDEDEAATRIQCSDGYTYSVVESHTRSIANGRAVAPTTVTDTAALCARIRRD